MKLYKGSIVTCDEKNSVYNYLVEDKGKIIFTGNELPEKYNISVSDTIDLAGKALLPAFGDGHIHFASWAMFNSTVDVRSAANIKEIQDQIHEYAKGDPGAKIVLVFGHSKHSIREKRLITKQELDTIESNRPVLVICYDGHSSVGNSAMIDMFPEKIKKLRGFNFDSGQLFNEAYLEGTSFASAMVSPLRVLKGVLKGVDGLAERGISMAHPVEGIGFPKDFDVDLVRMVARGSQVNLRVFFQTMDVKKVIKRKLPRIGGCFATALDGCFGATDAALLKPYSNNPDNRGILFYPDEKVIAFAKEANRAELQIEFHVIGDAGVAQAVRALEEALKDYPRTDHRHTLIHACLIAPEDLEKIAKLKIGITLQPAFLISNLEPIEYLKDILGDRAMGSSPLRKMIDMGIRVSGGSDAPVTPPDPIEGIYAACNHFNPEQSVIIPEALRMFTYEVAHAGFDEKERGSLETGKIADMVILNKNPLEMDPHNLRELKIEKILLEGKPYKRGKGIGGMIAGAIKGRNRKI
ncbi:MAG: amidohydrolase [Desulfobacterales bacterium]|nr:amidohydrolase [Desulfobacterales bacterium]